MDQSVWVKALHANGPSMLNVVVGNASNKNPDDDTENQCRWEFIQKKCHKLFQKRVPNPAEEKKLANDIGLQPVPPEIYRKNLSITRRRSLFYKTLFRKDILYLRVVNIRNPYDYKLQVVAKHGNCMRLEDLQIVMYLPKIPEETKFFKGGLWEFEYIRGALCSCSVTERKLFVTLDPLIFEGVAAPKLGKVGVNDLPFSLWCPEIGRSIYGYLIKSRVFYKAHLETVLQNVFGVESNQLYSFFQEWDGKKYPFEETPANFPKLFTGAKSSALLRRSIRLYIVGDIPKAFKYVNKALSLDPDAVYTRVCRGVLNVLRGSLTAAFDDTRDSLDLDRKSEIARKQMSALLVVAAEKYFERRDFTQLYKALLVAIGLNPGHFKGPAALETFKVVRYIYQMTRDPQFNFPLAPTHQKILGHFFKKEGSAHRKFVLPPNYEDDQASVSTRISLAKQMKKNQRSGEMRDLYHHHHQNQKHHRKRSKSGGRRRSSRSCSADRRRRSKSRTSELDLQRESRNRIDNANQDGIFGDSTQNQLRCDGYVNSGPNQRTRNKKNDSDSYTPNQLCGSDTQMNNFKKGRFRKQKRHSNLIVCVDSTSELEKESRLQKSFKDQDVTSEGKVLSQESTLGRRVNNMTNIAPLRSTRNKQIGSGMQRNNLSQAADSTPNQQSASGMLRTNPGQNVSIDSVSNQQRRSGTNISNSNQEVTVHNGSNLPCKDPQNNRNRCVDSVLNQLFEPSILKSNSNQSVSIQSEPNQQRDSVSCMSNTNHTIDSLSNQEHRSEVLKSGTLMNISNQRVSDDSMSNEMGRSQTHDSNTNIDISVDSISNQLRMPNIRENNLNQNVSVDPVPNQQSIFQIPGISANPDVVVHPHGTGILEINNDDRIDPANRMVSNLNKGTAFDSASSDLNTLRNREKQSISIDCVPNEQYECETSENKGNPVPRNSDIMKDHRVIDLNITTGHGQFETTRNLNQFSSAYSFPNQPHGSGMMTNNTNQDIPIYSTPGQQSGPETWMSNLNRGTTVDPKPRQQGGPGIPKHRVVPVFCTGIHKLIDTETMINALNKSPTDSLSKESHGVGTSKTNKKHDSTHDRRRGSKSQKSSFHPEDSVNSRFNQHQRSRNRVVSVSKPNELRDSTKRPSTADESSRPGSQMSNRTHPVSISSTPYQERDSRNQVSSSGLEVISVDCVPNDQSRPRTGNSDENEDIICVSYKSHSQRELEDEDVICLDKNPCQKSGSKSRSYKSDDRYGSVSCTCGQSKHSGSKCRRCDVDEQHRSKSPLRHRRQRISRSPVYHHHRRRSKSPYRNKRRGSRSHSSDHRHKRLGSRSHSSSRERRRNSRSRSPDDRRMLASQFF
ncbi:tetratricopeptide repeat protein 14 [Trichonephila inaurata madagascariensis]|uniref:Tetratricopeptide repeat protein 14 n=1 Tax=Trichonephila inaurata madagascariensis TaxID=2747483 RepID=A0A8X7CF99_9ARAC|nr:tetratricopeptide repeat protein 14 [Trichonephila inaurata madagascariensis]